MESYVQHLVEILTEVRRVLREDGTLWLVLGDSYKNKRLLGVPWLVVQALQAHGWILRSEITWAKTNVVPEHLHDRPARSSESIFLLSKNGRYFYDKHAVREESGAHLKGVWAINPRSGVTSEHSAVFPAEIPRRAILLATSEAGACSACGAPLERVVRKTADKTERTTTRYGRSGQGYHRQAFPSVPTPTYETLGWSRSCPCLTSRDVPCRVLDPFAGSGTTLTVAEKLGRQFTGIELVAKYRAGMMSRLGS